MRDSEKAQWLLDNCEDELSCWEKEFLGSARFRGIFTEKQAEILERLWRKHFDGEEE